MVPKICLGNFDKRPFVERLELAGAVVEIEWLGLAEFENCTFVGTVFRTKPGKVVSVHTVPF